jgi:hypothetical protein
MRVGTYKPLEVHDRKSRWYPYADSKCDSKKIHYKCLDCLLDKCFHDKDIPKVRSVLTNIC